MEQKILIEDGRGPLVRIFRKIVSVNSIQSIMTMLSTIVVRFLVLGLNFATTTLITRNLSPEDRGKYGYILNLTYFLMTFLCLGFHSSIVYIVSQKRSYFASLYSIAFYISLGSLILLALVASTGLLHYVSPMLNSLDIAILVLGVPLVLFYYFSSYFFVSMNNFKLYNLDEFFKSASFLLLTLFAFGTVLSYQYYMLFFIISNVIYILISLYQFFKLGYINSTVFYGSKSWRKLVCAFKKSANMTSISYVACVLSFLLSKYVLFFIGTFLEMGAEEKKALGYYSVALANADVSVVLPCTLALYILPQISSVQHLKDKVAIASRIIFLCIGYFAIIGVFSYFFLEDIFRLLYGTAYLASVPMFEMLLPSALFMSVISCIGSFIRGMGMEKSAIYAPLYGLVFMVVASVVLMKTSFNAYYFIHIQNVAYLIYLVIYVRFFLQKWKEGKNA